MLLNISFSHSYFIEHFIFTISLNMINPDFDYVV